MGLDIYNEFVLFFQILNKEKENLNKEIDILIILLYK